MKKLIVLLSLLLPLLAWAQDIDGTWKLHAAYVMESSTDLIDTEHYVYALSSGAVIRLDKASGQIEALSQSSGLADVMVKNIYYNYDERYLMIVYTTSNIDLLYEDGRIVNISDLADAVMNISRSVNDVTFSGKLAYLATDFGLVVLDTEQMRAIEFRNYGRALSSVALVGRALVVVNSDQLYVSSARREQFSDFGQLGVTQAAARVRAANDSTFFLLGTSALKRCEIGINEKGDWTCTTTSIVAATPNNLQRTASGWLANFRANSYYYTIKGDGTFAATKVSGDNKSLYSCGPDGDGSVWQIDNNGIHVKGSTAYYKPDGLYMRKPGYRLWYSTFNPWENKFYVTSAEQKLSAFVTSTNYGLKYILTYDGNQWQDVTPPTLINTSGMTKVTFIPGMANSYFFADRNYQFFRVQDGQVTGTFLNQNTTGPLVYATDKTRAPTLLLDHDYNLWFIAEYPAASKAVMVLPRAKIFADTVTAADWLKLDLSKFAITAQFQRKSIVESTTGEKVYTSGQMGSLINIWRQKPGSTDLTDVDVLATLDFTDQRGRALNTYQHETHVLAADSTGHVWVGGRTGVFYFKTADAFNPDFRITVPIANEGEDDPYDIQVTSIGVDPLNRKWIGTYDNGLYVVSADGSRVLRHFETGNSALPSQFIHEVAATLDRAIVVTENGVMELDMNEIPTTIDYTAVSAAPQFVEPGYTGFVTIGQVDVGACVRITDRNGNVVREFTATGNQVMWDTCDDQGERVPTGVYNIYAGLSADQLPGSPQVRVKVIK